MHNPFKQPVKLWQLQIFCPANAVALIEECFEENSLAVSSFEFNETESVWKVELLYDFPLNSNDIDIKLRIISESHSNFPIDFNITEVEQKDWQSEILKTFPPFRVRRFFIHGSHYKDAIPVNTIPLLIDAGTAFGSGEHETTSGCLIALDDILKRKKIKNALDMGCGSGILAISYVKSTNKKAVAIDIDAQSVKVAKQNFEINKTAQNISAYVGDGFKSGKIKKCKKFDLIFANILARPLVKMSKELSCKLSDNGGLVILSGLLNYQMRFVHNAYRMQGLRLVKHIKNGNWSILVMEK